VPAVTADIDHRDVRLQLTRPPADRPTARLAGPEVHISDHDAKLGASCAWGLERPLAGGGLFHATATLFERSRDEIEDRNLGAA
jgi:hypothetical protein